MIPKRDPSTPPVPLTIDEIRTLLLLGDADTEAMARSKLAKELQVAYLEQLRAKYGLGDDWACASMWEGFVKFIVTEDNDGDRPNN